jgi:3-ketosteroid 9alpha-monooxygenase subunit A
MSRFPFPIPTGWFCVHWSSELAIGQVKPIRYFAKDLVLFRTSDGVAHVLDAHCPHLGAHLGHGGCMKEDKLVCPFHAWEFDGDGACTNVPYATRQPKKAALKAWTVCEINGFIMVWHDLGGRAPLWDMPAIPEYGDAGWTPIRTREWTVNSCNQEMAENQVDAAHFHYLHGTQVMPETTCKKDGYRLITTATTGMATSQGPVDGMIHVNAWGFGFTTTRFTGIVETLLMSACSPVEEDRCELFFAFTVKDIGKGITGGVGKAFMAEIGRQLEQDIPVWENKIYIHPPLLVDGDGPIGKFRGWAKQFYPSEDQIAAAGA